MKQYFTFPTTRPDLDQIIYMIGNDGKEQLAIYKGGTRFDSCNGSLKGYYAKWWRALDSVEQKSFDDAQPVVRIKRKYTRRSVKTK